MSFLSEVYKLFGGGVGNIVDGFSVVYIDGKAVYVDGIVRILEISNERIRLATKKNIIEIEGKGLVISQSINDTITVLGEVVLVSKS